MHALTTHPDVSPGDRLGATAVFAIIAHLVVILGVTFVPEDRPERRPVTLDVALVPSSSEAAPDTPEFLARANHDGGGDGIEKRRPDIATPAPPVAEESAPTPVDPETGSEIPSAEPVRRPAPAQAARTLLELRAVAESGQPEEARPAQTAGESDPAPIPTPATTPSSVQDTDTAPPVSRSAAFAALSAEIERKLLAYSERPRRKWISARTREHEFAAYLDAWRRKVERVGNLNYPDDAARRGLAGDLLLEVALNPDGTVEDIALRRSSGQRILDEAAVRIVHLAAPFERFPEAIAREVDILHIQRTWVFHANRRFPDP